MHIEDHDPLDRLQEATRQYRNTRTWPRVQAIILARLGDTAAQIARVLGVSRRAVQAWAAAYNRGGLGALPERPHRHQVKEYSNRSGSLRSSNELGFLRLF
jgi:transposase